MYYSLLVGLFRIHFFTLYRINWITRLALRLHLEFFLFFLLFREFFLTLFEAVIRSCQGDLSVISINNVVALTLTAYCSLLKSHLHGLR